MERLDFWRFMLCRSIVLRKKRPISRFLLVEYIGVEPMTSWLPVLLNQYAICCFVWYCSIVLSFLLTDY